MNNTYTLNICGLKRELPVVRLNKHLSIASFVILGDTQLIESTADSIMNHPGFPASRIDFLVCPEAKAIPLAHALARRLNLNYIVVRKSVKAYMGNQITEESEAITTEGKQILVLDGSDAEKIRGKNMCIIDDVVSTGGSLAALERLLNKTDCHIICKAAILLEDAGYEGKDLVYLEKLPVFRD